MSKQKTKWWEVYTNDEEKRFFVGKDGHSGLVRNAEYNWRSTDSLAKESGLSKARIEQIIDKYHKAGIVVQHPKDPEKWGYWQNVAKDTATASVGTVADDQKSRIDKATKKKV